MKVYNDNVLSLDNVLYKVLKNYRNDRNFNVEKWLDKKVSMIIEYFEKSSLTTAVIGMSGGIDSSVAYALMKEASIKNPKIIQRVVPLALPALNNKGATHQEDTLLRAKDVCAKYGDELIIYNDLSLLVETATKGLENVLNKDSSDWSTGQLVAYMRTPLLYNTCSILTDNGQPAIVIGTTNLSEGAYLGYVGKASDGITDLQIITDLFKSEVYQVAQYLDLPHSVINVTPSGDMYDGRSDEELFGVTYDFIELHHLSLMKNSFYELLDNDLFKSGYSRIMKLHDYNKHKYLYSMPSVFINIMETNIPGGWNLKNWDNS